MLYNILLFIARCFVGYIVKPIILAGFRLYYRCLDKPRPLPPIDNELLLIPAHELAKKIRQREIKSLQVTQAYIDRIKQINPLINCVVADRFQDALEEAKQVDFILDNKSTTDAKYSESNAPLLGVPFSCKESKWVQGMPCAVGLIARKDFRAPHDDIIVKNVKKSGAILTCVTTTSELNMWMETSTYLNGTTRNPYNLSRVVGGSSGGEAAIISSAGSLFGIGGDIGGSLRNPAYFTGIFTHKPSHGLMESTHQHPPVPKHELVKRLLYTGPMCRYAADLSLLFKVFAGENYKKVAKDFEKEIDLKKLKYYYMSSMQDFPFASDLSTDSKQALQRAISCIERDLGVQVREIRLSGIRHIFKIYNAMCSNGQATGDTRYKYLCEDTPGLNLVVELVKSLCQVQTRHTWPTLALAFFQKHIPVKEPMKYVKLGEELKKELEDILGDDGILLFPSYPIVAPYHNQMTWTNLYDFAYFSIWNALSMPVTQIPMGLSEREQLPTGIQLVVKPDCDALSIRLAQYFEAHHNIGWTKLS